MLLTCRLRDDLCGIYALFFDLGDLENNSTFSEDRLFNMLTKSIIMKKLLFLMTVCLLSITGPSMVQASPSHLPEATLPDIRDASPEIQAVVKRFEESKAMDFKSLNADQRKALRHELKEMKKNKTVTGVYLSTGAIIIILLILLLVL